MIVKIQRPIRTNERVPKALIYNQDRSVEYMPDLTDVEELFGPHEFKIYHHATINGKNQLVIGNRAPVQVW